MLQRSAPSRRHAGFTLIEMTVVVVILAVFMTMAVPRLTISSGRTFDLTMDRIADLLTMYAHRDSVGTRPVGLLFDPPTRSLVLMSLMGGVEDDAPVQWTIDPLVRPVALPPEVDVSTMVVIADGELIDLASSPLSHTPGSQRPSIELYVDSSDGEHNASIVLAPYDVSPSRIDGRRTFGSATSVDLDAAGRSREDW